MSSNLQPIVEVTPLTAVAALYFTAANFTRIEKITGANTDAGGAHTATLWWVAAGGVNGPANLVIPLQSFDANEASDFYAFVGHTLAPGDQIWAMADAPAVVNLYASGTVITSGP